MALELSLLDYLTRKVPGILCPQKLFMMAWNSGDILGFLLHYISIYSLEFWHSLFNETDYLLYPFRGQDSYHCTCEVYTLS